MNSFWPAYTRAPTREPPSGLIDGAGSYQCTDPVHEFGVSNRGGLMLGYSRAQDSGSALNAPYICPTPNDLQPTQVGSSAHRYETLNQQIWPSARPSGSIPGVYLNHEITLESTGASCVNGILNHNNSLGTPARFSDQLLYHQTSLPHRATHSVPYPSLEQSSTNNPGLSRSDSIGLYPETHHSSAAYFLMGDIVCYFDRTCKRLFEVNSSDPAQDKYIPLQDIPTPAPASFTLNGNHYRWSAPAGIFFLDIRDEALGVWTSVPLFREVGEARLEQSKRIIKSLAAFLNFGDGLVTPACSDGHGRPKSPLLKPAINAKVDNHKGKTSSDVSKPSSSTHLAVSQAKRQVTVPPSIPTPSQSRIQNDQPFHLKSHASKKDIDDYCANLKSEGDQNVSCPFCLWKQDRVSSLQRHLYFRFRVNPYICSKGCGQKFSTPDNAKRHSEKNCDGLPSSRRSRSNSDWEPRCQPPTRRPRRNVSLNAG